MKLFTILAAAGLVAASAVPVLPAASSLQAAPHHRGAHGRRHNVRYRTVCRTRWHNGNRVRRCTRVRIYR